MTLEVLISIIMPSQLKTRMNYLGIVLDSKFSFEDHINCLCKKRSQKLNALARIAPYICRVKKKKNSYENIWNISF